MKIKSIEEMREETMDIRRMVSFCPNCLTYGTPFGLRDTVCGNCHKDGLRQYVGLEDALSLFSSQIKERDEAYREEIKGMRTSCDEWSDDGCRYTLGKVVGKKLAFGQVLSLFPKSTI